MDIKKGAEIKLIKSNPINRIFRQYISKHKSELCYDNNIPTQVIQYSRTSNHSLKTQQINFVINSLGSDWAMFIVVFNAFLEEKERSTYYGNKIITDISINNDVHFLTNTNHKILIYICML